MLPGRLRALLSITAAMLLVIAVSAACGGGSSTPTGPARTATPTIASKVVNEGPAAAEIDQNNLTFKPGTATVKVGEKVLFKDSETAIHTVNINGKNISGNMKKGDQVYWTASAPGTYKVSCDYHPQMHATITVLP